MDSDWQNTRKKLIDVAMGRLEADLVVMNGRWVSVQSGEIIDSTDIAVIDGLIAFVGPDAAHTIGENTQVIDASGRYLVPGLLDGHMHVESSMLTITEFVRAVLPRGTTGIFIDPHEIANVFGLEGVRLMVDESAVQPIHVWVQVPSCVPSAPGLETPGASIEPKDVAEAMKWEGIIGLGEVMNFPGVFNGDEKMLSEMAETSDAGKNIGGHYASPDLGLPFHGYAAGGPEDDHEGTRHEDAVARIRQGMKVMMRYGSAWLDVAEQIRAVTESGLDPRHFILCTDDSHSETLVKEGHMDRVVRHAVEQGIDPLVAIQMATINTAEHFRVDREIGMIAPGRYADILLVSDLTDFKPDMVIAKGVVMVEGGALTQDIPPYPYPDWVTTSVKVGHTITANDFDLSTDISSPVLVNVIGVVENQAPTRHIRKEVEVVDGKIAVNVKEDLAKIALVERHRGTGEVQVGLVTGFGFTQSCGIASTVAHDSHHMIVVGTNENDMALAANELARVGGGQTIVVDGKVVGMVELPIAGLMSNEPAKRVAEKAGTILEGFRKCGCKINNPNMQMSLLALVVIPELRLSDKGLVDVTKFEFIPVVEGK
ncbi:MAG: adenine deaminase [Anaerolineales bacterium]|jgi:adenine deaminase